MSESDDLDLIGRWGARQANDDRLAKLVVQTESAMRHGRSLLVGLALFAALALLALVFLVYLTWQRRPILPASVDVPAHLNVINTRLISIDVTLAKLLTRHDVPNPSLQSRSWVATNDFTSGKESLCGPQPGKACDWEWLPLSAGGPMQPPAVIVRDALKRDAQVIVIVQGSHDEVPLSADTKSVLESNFNLAYRRGVFLEGALKAAWFGRDRAKEGDRITWLISPRGADPHTPPNRAQARTPRVTILIGG